MIALVEGAERRKTPSEIAELQAIVERIARVGGTPLVVAERSRPLGVVHLKDIVKGGMRQRFAALRAMGIKTVMEIAASLGVGPGTIEMHRGRIMEKLDAHSAVELVPFAVRRGIIS